MAEALWVGGTGITYNDFEDRHLIAAMYTQGVIGSGLTLTAGVGVVSYSPGFCAIADGTGGMYLAYFDAAGTAAATVTSTVYVRINKTTAASDIVASTSLPSSATYAFFAIGSVTASGSTLVVDPPPANRQATLRGAAGASGFLPVGGGTLTGPLSAPQVSVPGGLLATSSGLQAPNGVRLGAAANYTQRLYARAARYTSRQSIPGSAWTVVLFNTLDRDINDYGAAGSQYDAATGRFYQPVGGVYHFSGSAHFTDLGGSVVNPRLLTRLMSYTSAGVVRMALNTTWREAGGQEDFVQWEGTLDCPAGGWVTFEIRVGGSTAMYLGGDDTTTGTYGTPADGSDPGQRTWGTQTLLMAE